MKIKTTLFLLFFGLFTLVGFGQYGASQKKVDSLLKAFKDSKKDTASVQLLVELWRATINSNVDSAVTFANKIISLSNQLNYDTGISTGHQRLGIAYSYLADYNASNKEYKKALRIYEKHHSMRMMGSMLFNIGINHQVQGLYDSAFYYNKLAAKNFLQINDSLRLGSVYDQNASIYLERGQYLLSLQNAMEASKIFKKNDDRPRYGDALLKIADNYDSMGNQKLAVRYYLECLAIFKATHDDYYKAEVFRKLGMIYRDMDPMQKDSAQYYLKESLQLSHKLKATSLYGLALNQYGHLELKMHNPTKALDLFEKALKTATKIGTKLGRSSNFIDIGYSEFLLGDNPSALKQTLSGLDISISAGIADNTNRAYQNLSKIYKKKGDFQQALEYHEKFKMLNDSIYNIEKATKLSELQTLYETEKKEAAIALQKEEIKTLNEKAKVDKLTKGLYAGGMASGLALSGLLFFGFRQRMKKNRIAREKQEEIYRQEIEHKKKELASQTLHLVQKNTFIQELKENLESLRSSPEKFKVEFRRIVMLLKKQSAGDRDWEVFKTYFAEVHNDFDQKLKTLHADISEKEIRLAAFLRMNLSTKEIAAMLNVMPDSILKSKYRLKKKLQLDKKLDLTGFLNTL